METGDEVKQLLAEIRDMQRERLDEYRRAAQQSLEFQHAGAARQADAMRLVRRIYLTGGVLIIALMGLLVYLLVKWSPQLFGQN